MLKSTRTGQGRGKPHGIGRYDLPARPPAPVRRAGMGSPCKLAAGIATQRQAAWAEYQSGNPAKWEVLKNASSLYKIHNRRKQVL